MPLTKPEILTALKNVFEPLPYIHAMWEGGAAAWNRVDEWSDIDLQIDVDDDHADEVIPLVDQTLAALSPIERRYQMPPSGFQLHAQVFYRLQDAGPFLLMDVAVLKHSTPTKYAEPEIHGHAVIHFDKSGVVPTKPLDPAEWDKQLTARVASLRVLFPLFQSLTLKELNRGNSIEALAFYNGYTLRPLLELLRIKYAPFHHNFHTRYVHYELPPQVVARLETLFYAANPLDLAHKREQAEAWFNEALAAWDDNPSANYPSS
jgi:hypothetical protein